MWSSFKMLELLLLLCFSKLKHAGKLQRSYIDLSKYIPWQASLTTIIHIFKFSFDIRLWYKFCYWYLLCIANTWTWTQIYLLKVLMIDHSYWHKCLIWQDNDSDTTLWPWPLIQGFDLDLELLLVLICCLWWKHWFSEFALVHVR